MQTLNREQRRALKSNKGPKRAAFGTRRPVDVTPMFRNLNDCRQLKECETTTDHAVTRMRFNALADGTAQPIDFDEVAMRINTLSHRCKQIDEALMPIVDRAQRAMDCVRDRYMRSGKFGFAALERTAVLDALDLLEEVVNKSSRRQMQESWAAAVRVCEIQMKGV